MIIGGAVSMGLSKKVSPLYLLAIGFAVNALCLMVAGISTFFWLTFTAEFFIGFVTPAFQVAIQTLILKNTEESFVGRINGILTPLFMGAMVLTMSFAGWLKDALSVFTMYEMAGILFLISAFMTIPMFRMQMNTATYEKSQTQAGEWV
jgi:DHA3 family macrolide efflux protein-like MFS transporter